MAIDDETLMAYADGDLGAEAARAVARALEADPALAAKVAAFAAARRAVKAAHAAPPEVPAELAARIRALAAEAGTAMPRDAAVVELAARRRPAPVWQLPLAASIALVVGGLGGWIAATDRGPAGGPAIGPTAGMAIAAVADPAVIAALDRLPSGGRETLPGGAELVAIASFRDAAGTLCREVEHTGTPAASVLVVACHAGGAWDLRLAVAGPAADGSAYSPASALDTVEAFLAASGVGPALSEAEERAALDALR